MKINITGMDEASKIFADMEANLNNAINSAVYDAAAILADEVKAGLEALPTLPTTKLDKNGDPKFQTKGHMLNGVSPKQKEDLMGALGIAPFQKKSGEVSTSVGFDGYGRSTWHNGEPLPNQVLMREVESGTSWMMKHPVVRPAVNRTKEKIKEKMEQTFVSKIQKEK